MAKPTSAETRRPCAAVTRDGTGCRRPAAPGRVLCAVHAAGAQSLYGEGIGEEERRLWDQISVTDLDAEIRVAKLQLKRLLDAQRRAELAGADDSTGASAPGRKSGARMTAKPRSVDYDERVNRLLGRISDLVVTRARLQRDADAKNKEDGHDPADDPVERLARRIDRVSARIGAATDPGEPDAGGGGTSGS